MDMMLNKIKSFLGEPFYQTSGCLIYNLDCSTAMDQLSEPMIDLTVTSPPYNIGKEYEEVQDIEEYLDWCESWIFKVYRLTMPHGAFFLNIGYISLPGRAKAIPIPYLLWNRIPFFLLQEIVWNYGAGVAARKMLSPRNEKFLWYVKSPQSYTFNLDAIRDKDVKYPHQKKRGKLRCNTLGKNPSDVWQIAKVTSGKNRSSLERTPHPAQFPIDLIERIVKGFSNHGELVMDPFIGSGTTAESCLRNGRKVLGFEINTGYCELAARRIENYLKDERIRLAQGTLFETVNF